MTSLFDTIDQELGIKDNTLTKDLMQRPTPDKGANKPHITVEGKGTHQMDLLELPNDNGYRYALVIVDVATRACDAEQE
eukprot:m.97071 g.97071  ORF g.97071 m.97071 type:complete len:79 (-) comp14815_c1_seq2:1164-1400(-)